MPNRRQSQRLSKAHTRSLKLRDQLWPNLKDYELWQRTKEVGFTTIPRTMPLLLQIMDDMSNGKPVSGCYLALWGRVWDECMVTITNPRELAFESGYTGQRAEYTWVRRMRTLLELKFIDSRPGPSGEFNYVLIWHPYKVVAAYRQQGTIQDAKYNALYARALEIGEDALDYHMGGSIARLGP